MFERAKNNPITHATLLLATLINPTLAEKTTGDTAHPSSEIGTLYNPANVGTGVLNDEDKQAKISECLGALIDLSNRSTLSPEVKAKILLASQKLTNALGKSDPVVANDYVADALLIFRGLESKEISPQTRKRLSEIAAELLKCYSPPDAMSPPKLTPSSPSPATNAESPLASSAPNNQVPSPPPPNQPAPQGAAPEGAAPQAPAPQTAESQPSEPPPSEQRLAEQRPAETQQSEPQLSSPGPSTVVPSENPHMVVARPSSNNIPSASQAIPDERGGREAQADDERFEPVARERLGDFAFSQSDWDERHLTVGSETREVSLSLMSARPLWHDDDAIPIPFGQAFAAFADPERSRPIRAEITSGEALRAIMEGVENLRAQYDPPPRILDVTMTIKTPDGKESVVHFDTASLAPLPSRSGALSYTELREVWFHIGQRVQYDRGIQEAIEELQNVAHMRYVPASRNSAHVSFVTIDKPVESVDVRMTATPFR